MPRKFPKPFHEYATIKRRVKVQKVRKISTQQLYNADLGLSVWPLSLRDGLPLPGPNLGGGPAIVWQLLGTQHNLAVLNHFGYSSKPLSDVY